MLKFAWLVNEWQNAEVKNKAFTTQFAAKFSVLKLKVLVF